MATAQDERGTAETTRATAPEGSEDSKPDPPCLQSGTVLQPTAPRTAERQPNPEGSTEPGLTAFSWASLVTANLEAPMQSGVGRSSWLGGVSSPVTHEQVFLPGRAHCP